MDNQEKQGIIDEDHLKLLSIFYYVSGGATAFFSTFAIIYIFLGAIFTALPHRPEGPPAFMGWFFMVIGIVVLILGWTIGALKIYTGYCLSKRKHRVFCLIVAVISSLAIPYGTVLAVFTFIVLLRDSVRKLFERETAHT